MAKDALDPITIEFLEDLGVWGQTDSISDTITITLNSGTADDNIGKGFDVASFGHELFHLLRQESDELGTAKSEKDAYDYEATLLKNMGVPLDPAWAVTVISNLGTSKEEMKKIAKALNVPVSNSLFNQDPITNWVGEAIEAVFQTVTGCYRSVYSMSCFPPGPYDVRYEPPSK